MGRDGELEKEVQLPMLLDQHCLDLVEWESDHLLADDLGAKPR